MVQKRAIDRGAVATAWAERGFTCGLWVDPPGQVWEGFVHDVDELFLLVDGELLLELGERVLRPRPGEEIVIPAGARHTVRNVGERNARWLYGYRSAG